MNIEVRVKILENAYVGVLVDSLYNYTNQGVLDKVTVEKRNMQMLTGKKRAEQLGVTKPEDVFKILSNVFNCTNWEIEQYNDGFEAIAKSCKLCVLAKKMDTESPCNIYCLDPMEGMIKGINPQLNFEVSETLWHGKICKIKIGNK